EMRHHRARHYQCSEDGETVRAAGRSPGRNKRRARKAVVERKWLGTDCRGRSRGRRQKGGFCRERQMKIGLTIVFLAIAATLCGETDFDSELAGYRAAFRALKKYDFIDTKRIYMLGISNGGGFAPLVPESDPEQAQVRGYISMGGWVKTWFEHMLEIERRRFAL